jgi:hypothetical protein
MTKPQPAVCPRCGNTKPDVIDERMLEEDGKEVRVLLFRCVCGHTFTQTVKKSDGKVD